MSVTLIFKGVLIVIGSIFILITVPTIIKKFLTLIDRRKLKNCSNIIAHKLDDGDTQPELSSKHLKLINIKTQKFNKKGQNEKEKISNKVSLIEEKSNEPKNLNKKIASSFAIAGGLATHAAFKTVEEVVNGLYFDDNIDDKSKEKKIKTDKKEEKKKENVLVGNVNSEQYDTEYDKIDDNENNLVYQKDYNEALELIKKEINDQKQEFQQFQNIMININPIQKKETMLSKIKKSVLGIINIMISFIPLKLFKNKGVGIITSAIILNGRIKYLKSILNNQNNILELENCKQILKQIEIKENFLLKTKEINTNSLDELDNIEEEIITKYMNDLDNEDIIVILNNIGLLKNKIMKENVKIENQLERNKKLEIEQKQKIKKLEI
jgi:hypothetical protein